MIPCMYCEPQNRILSAVNSELQQIFTFEMMDLSRLTLLVYELCGFIEICLKMQDLTFPARRVQLHLVWGYWKLICAAYLYDYLCYEFRNSINLFLYYTMVQIKLSQEHIREPASLEVTRHLFRRFFLQTAQNTRNRIMHSIFDY